MKYLIATASMNCLVRLGLVLPVVLLMACGGGSGGSENVNPLTQFRPTANSSSMEAVEAITELYAVIPLFSKLAEAGNFGNEVGHIAYPGTKGGAYVVALPGVDHGVTFTLQGFGNLSLVPNDTSLFSEYGSRITNSLTVGDATLARGSLTTMIQRDTPLEFETFAGWFDSSVFGTTQIAVGASGNEQYRFISYIFGVPNTSKPFAIGAETLATWEGATVASIKADRTFIRGDAIITVPDLDNADVDVILNNWRNINGQAVSSVQAISYEGLMLTNGGFQGSGDEQVEGWFFGANHVEVGGHFNTVDVMGAFGGTRQ